MVAKAYTLKTERLLYASGKVELWVRLSITPFGLLFSWCAYLLAVRHEIIAAVISSIFGLLFLSIWLYEWRMYYDTSQRKLVFRSWGTRYISLSGAEAVYSRRVQSPGGITGGGPFVDIGLRYRGGRDKLLLRQPLNDPKHVAVLISEATALPIIEK